MIELKKNVNFIFNNGIVSIFHQILYLKILDLMLLGF